MHLVFFPGLGADERVFQDIFLPGHTKQYLQWLPVRPEETLEGYTRRLAEQVTSPEICVFVGVSFGGIVAQVMSRFRPPHRLVLISSFVHPHELPPLFRALGKLRITRWFPMSLLRIPTPFTYWMFGADNARTRGLLSNILHDTDVDFLRWALQQGLAWSGNTGQLIHLRLHGTRDRLLPPARIHGFVPIHRGGHLMVLTQAEQINRQLSALLANEPKQNS
ncbi:Alpha/beta hydrolase family protein [Catalinimonas alkaloidigena]|uniref:Alpha/beta hydrolase family protein n=1 Tax=Catalinimonas alkaloidigena TaxID=1075417 RepID=A0A1G9BD63_9BACT|nr:alpha/beta hydrolase [Catalinimonas alkaloidigena]SDK37421.1 Alpha/beta hydrolase family protein [Catalinimonas alkaloidigena]